MTTTTTVFGGVDSSETLAESTTRDPPEYECYCGLGPACPIFGQMTAEQQQECTRDKRRTAQQYYRNGIGW
jgi:hypothetical protein